jgi:hypothetical protein
MWAAGAVFGGLGNDNVGGLLLMKMRAANDGGFEMRRGMRNNFNLRCFVFIALLLVSGCSKGAADSCVDVTFGSVHLSVPKQQRISAFGNFTFAFDTHIPGVDCPLGCDELFVNASPSVVSHFK